MKFKRNCKLTKKRRGRKVKKNMRKTKCSPLMLKKRSRINRKRSRRGGMRGGNKCADMVIDAILSDTQDPDELTDRDTLVNQLVNTDVDERYSKLQTELYNEFENEFNNICNNSPNLRLLIRYAFAYIINKDGHYYLLQFRLKMKVAEILKTILRNCVGYHDTDAGTGDWRSKR